MTKGHMQAFALLACLSIRGSPGFCEGVLRIGITPVDGREGHGTDVKGVAWVVIKLQLVSALLFTHAKHLLCRLLDLHTQGDPSCLY